MIGTADGNVYETEMHHLLDIPVAPDLGSNGNKNLSQGQEDQNKEIYFVRHGCTNLNNEDKVRSWSTDGLDDDGRGEARKAAESVGDIGITHIVASDLPRAAETARIIGKKIGVTPEYDPNWRTWDLGGFEGQKESEVGDKIKALTMNPDQRPPAGRTPGETFNEFKDRILSAVANTVNNHREHEVLVVSHSSPERVLHAWDEAGQPMKASA